MKKTNTTKNSLIHMPKGFSRTIHLCMLLLSIFGMIMITSANMNSFSSNQGLISVIIKQMVFVLVSYIAMVVVAKKFTWNWFKSPTISTVLMLGMIVFLTIPRFFTYQYGLTGSYNWIDLRFFTIQPSEFAKILMICLIAFALGKLPIEEYMLNKSKLAAVSIKQAFDWIFSQIKRQFIVVILMIGIVFIVQKDTGTALIMVLVAAIMVLVAYHPLLTKIQKPLFVVVLLGVALLIFVMSEPGIEFLYNIKILQPHQVERFRALYHMFDPEYSLKVSSQQVRGLLAFARGGLWGHGLGQSIQKYGYLPEAHSDYIIAIVIEEFGFVGFMLVTVGYFIIIGILLRYAILIKHQPSRLTLIGIASYFFMHYLVNIGGTSGLIPLTGVPLLLISSGGSSQMASYVGIGIAQNIIARYEAHRRKRLEQAQ